MTYRIYLMVIIVGFFTVTCRKEKANPSIDAPPAIKAMIPGSCSNTCTPYIDEYEWRSQTIYLSSCVGITCKCAIALLLPNGETLKLDAGYDAFDFLKEATLVRHVWRCTP